MKFSQLTKSTGIIRQKTKNYWQWTRQWLFKTPERALEDAYNAALIIKSIEDEHFSGKKISSESANYSPNVISYWQVYLDKNLTTIKVKLAEFKLSRSVLNISDPVLLEKLKLIDQIIAKYQVKDNIVPAPIAQPANKLNNFESILRTQPSFSDPSAGIPRSIERTLKRITDDLNPKAEEKFVRNFRISRNRTRGAFRFLVTLIIVPILTQQLAKQFLVMPIVNHTRGEHPAKIFLNSEMEEKALEELKSFERELKFEKLLHKAPELTSEVLEEKVKDKAIEISRQYITASNNAISNVFADLVSLIAFAIIVATNRREIATLKAFMDEIVYGISDSAKAFIIILSTDIFVGFHSPDGWEVLLESLAQHLGIPATRSAIFLFIATFPVILNTVFKYWIFRYLSRLSPSALATLKEMDE